jgi:hypothetical protein
MKKILLVFLALLALIIIIYFSPKLMNLPKKITFQKEVYTARNVYVSVEESPDFNHEQPQIDAGLFDAWLDKIGFNPRVDEVALLGEFLDQPKKWVKPEKIILRLTETSQKYEQVFDQKNQIVGSFGESFDEKNKVMTLDVQFNPTLFKTDSVLFQRNTELNMLSALYVISHYAPKQKSLDRIKSWTKILEQYGRDSKNQSIFFHVSQNQSGLFQNLVRFFVPDALAYCSGSYQCGIQRYVCPDGSGCSSGQSCQFNGGGNCSPYCDPFDKACAGASEISCLTGCNCSGGNCGACSNVSCTWTNLEPTAGPTGTNPGPCTPCNVCGSKDTFLGCGTNIAPGLLCDGDYCTEGEACHEQRPGGENNCGSCQETGCSCQCHNEKKCVPDPNCRSGAVSGNILDSTSNQYLKPAAANTCASSFLVNPLAPKSQNVSNYALSFSCNSTDFPVAKFDFYPGSPAASGSINNNSTYVRTGKQSYVITSGGAGEAYLEQHWVKNSALADNTVIRGQTFTFSAWVKTTGAATAYLRLGYGGNSSLATSLPAQSFPAWKKITISGAMPASFPVPNTGILVRMVLAAGSTSGSKVYFDDLSLTMAGDPNANLIIDPSFESATQYTLNFQPDQIYDYHLADVFITPPASATSIKWKSNQRNLLTTLKNPGSWTYSCKPEWDSNTWNIATETIYLSAGNYRLSGQGLARSLYCKQRSSGSDVCGGPVPFFCCCNGCQGGTEQNDCVNPDNSKCKTRNFTTNSAGTYSKARRPNHFPNLLFAIFPLNWTAAY